MVAPKWKFQKEKKKSAYDTYLRFENEIPKKVKCNMWTFVKNGYNDSLFTCTILEEDGVKVDKMWSVWNVDLRDYLKKKLKSTSPHKVAFEMIIVRHEKDLEDSFEIKEELKFV